MIGNFVKNNPENFSLVIIPENMRIFDKNSNHVWNSLSYYWQRPIAEVAIEEKRNDTDSESM